MTDLRKAAELAFDALDIYREHDAENIGIADAAYEALRQALAMEKFSEVNQEIEEALKQTEQEPVAWMYVNDAGECEQIEYGEPFDDPSVTPLYTAPPKREWVGLTDEEKKRFVVAYFVDKYDRETAVTLMDDYEAVLKEKNT